MALPSPLLDDPTKWDGWRRYNSTDLYERLCLTFESRPTAEQIEDHTRQLLVWWQKKLPLKNQPSNPMAQLLRGGLDAAPRYLAEARAELLNPERRAEIDAALFESRRQGALAEFQKFLDFALAEKVLTRDAETNLFKLARALGLRSADVTDSIRDGLIDAGAVREAELPHFTPEALAPLVPPEILDLPGRTTLLVAADSQYSPEEERRRFPEFTSSIGTEMLLVTTGRFLMGSRTPESPIDEQPATQVTLRRFYLSRFPITNAQYEQFDPAHAKWRGRDAGDTHPVVYVTHADAVNFCSWLSERETKTYRLPTEAEWEYAARGTDGRIYPWALTPKFRLAKFTAPAGGNGRAGGPLPPPGENGTVAPSLDRMRVETLPVGNYPLGASPFGIEDLLGNVWEWCEDFYGVYKGAERIDPRGLQHGTHRVCRGGSWKSRFASLKTTTRGYQLPTYASNDVGFRIACDCA